MDRPCRVAITNSEPFHFETLESIGTLLPFKFLRAAAFSTEEHHHQQQQTGGRGCRTWIFDLHLPQRPTPRFAPWVKYFTKHVQGVEINQDDIIDPDNKNTTSSTRTWGRLVLYPKKSNWPTIPSRIARKYDVMIEASCYCQAERGLQQLANNPRQVCIFHQACPTAAQSLLWANRSVWLSPHHRPRYYLPTALPKVGSNGHNHNNNNNNNDSLYAKRSNHTPLQLCVTGNSRRRQWSLLEHYLQQQQQYRVTPSPPLFDIRIYSDGGLPIPLQPYASRVHLVNTNDYWEFHASIATRCHALIFLVTRQGNANYFPRAGDEGLQKLTGSMPLVVAYRIPYMVHEELYDLYQDDLPIRDDDDNYDDDVTRQSTIIPFATHTDDAANFTAALSEFLPRLQNYYYGDQAD
uniref:Uncharacterized protein n=1 Tax=Amphora coffeiformis TaxID=265554 RepID=A0A7S3P9E3_9STRA